MPTKIVIGVLTVGLSAATLAAQIQIRRQAPTDTAADFPLAEIEAIIYEHPDVADVAVIGVPDDRLGERVHAVVVTQPGAVVELETVMDFCRSRLAGYKLPRSMELVKELPRNTTGKILKKELRLRHWEGHQKKV